MSACGADYETVLGLVDRCFATLGARLTPADRESAYRTAFASCERAATPRAAQATVALLKRLFKEKVAFGAAEKHKDTTAHQGGRRGPVSSRGAALGCSIETLNAATSALGAGGKCGSALALFARLKAEPETLLRPGDAVDGFTYAAAISACAHPSVAHERWRDALRLLAEAALRHAAEEEEDDAKQRRRLGRRRRGGSSQSSSSKEPTTTTTSSGWSSQFLCAKTVGAALVACERGRASKQAAAVLRAARRRDVELDTSCYDAAILAQRTDVASSASSGTADGASGWKTAIALLRELRRASKLEPTARTYAALLETLVAADQMERADVVYAAARQRGVMSHAHAVEGRNTVDLHHHTKASARCALRAALREADPAAGDLQIIVGRGKRSVTALEPVLRDVVLGALRREHDIETAAVMESNNGRVVVPSEALTAWWQRQSSAIKNPAFWRVASSAPLVNHPALVLLGAGGHPHHGDDDDDSQGSRAFDDDPLAVLLDDDDDDDEEGAVGASSRSSDDHIGLGGGDFSSDLVHVLDHPRWETSPQPTVAASS